MKAPHTATMTSLFMLYYIFFTTLLVVNVNKFDVEAFTPSWHFNKSRRLNRRNADRSRILVESGLNNQPPVTKSLNDEALNPSWKRTKLTLSFPPFYALMDAKPGEYIASEAFACLAPIEYIEDDGGGTNTNKICSTKHRFRVKLYPRGGGVGRNQPRSQSSLVGKFPSILQSRSEEVVGLYLQYLGCEGSEGELNVDGNSIVNATFALRLKGRQTQKRFDIEWRAGMRFVSDAKNSNLNQGDANSFGFPLMQTNLMEDFMGIVDSVQKYDPAPILVDVEVLIHNTALEEMYLRSSVQKTSIVKQQLCPDTNKYKLMGVPFLKDVRQRVDATLYGHDAELVRVGKIVVPVLSRLNQRPKMFEQGTYPGVEYRILRILKNGQERFTSCPGAEYQLKPIYPLVSRLERQWPIRVKEEDIPGLCTPSIYNTLSVFGALFTSITGLFTAFLLSQAISLFFIPSKSMDPTLKVGDVLLVDKFSSRTFLYESSRNKVGDIVLFSPPNGLQQVVARSGGKLNSRDLFVKRIAASTGDKVTVYNDGKVEINDENVVDGRRDLCETEPLRLIEKYVQPSQDYVIHPKEVFVMGDCSSVSVDSRVWGTLETKNIVGRPIIRLWPLDRFGKVE